MKPSIYIDGAAGTTGLEIRERLAQRDDIAIVSLAGHERKDMTARARALNDADVAILCLPDDAAREAVACIENPRVRVLDASTAHRAAEGWIYGFPELKSGQRAAIAGAGRVSNPGCYATAFLALIRPLIRTGIVPADFPLTVSGVSGYSGGGKAMIEEFENEASPRFTRSVVRTYALSLAHKHVPEMQAHAGLVHPPLFAPSVGRYYRGMLVEVPLQLWALPGRPSTSAIHGALAGSYADEVLVEVEPQGVTPATLDAQMLGGSDRLKLFVFGNDQTQQARLVAVLDNLGKGASGAAVQNLNLMLGLPETTGLQ